MTITAIEKLAGKKKVRIYLNDAPAFLLYPGEVREYKLEEGMEIDDSLLETIYSAVLLKRAKLRLMHILKSQDKTEWQLRSKLRSEEVPEEVADRAIEYVKSYHYVDDLRYAGAYIRSRGARKSKAQMKADLAAKGVSSDVIAQALEENAPDDSSELVRYWMEKKRFDPETADPDTTRKFVQFLQRKGLSYSEIKKSLT